jgi:hypothetical protein
MASAAGLLAFNLWAFPVPPADAGLVDLGPVTGAWWVIVIVILLRTERKPGEHVNARISGPGGKEG